MGIFPSLRLAHYLGLPARLARKAPARGGPATPAAALPAAPSPDLAARLAAERRQERARCAAIIGSANGLRFTPMALQLATGTDLSAAEAVAILDSCAVDAAQAASLAVVHVRPSLAQRMAALGDDANPAPRPGAATLPAEQGPVASILASASKARGEASPIPTTHRT
jgi:hypothetical protein